MTAKKSKKPYKPKKRDQCPVCGKYMYSQGVGRLRTFSCMRDKPVSHVVTVWLEIEPA